MQRFVSSPSTFCNTLPPAMEETTEDMVCEKDPVWVSLTDAVITRNDNSSPCSQKGAMTAWEDEEWLATVARENEEWVATAAREDDDGAATAAQEDDDVAVTAAREDDDRAVTAAREDDDGAVTAAREDDDGTVTTREDDDGATTAAATATQDDNVLGERNINGVLGTSRGEMGERIPVDNVRELVERVEEVVSRLNKMESRMSDLEGSVNKAVGTMMPKVEALLSARSGEDAPTSNAAVPSTNPVPSCSTFSFSSTFMSSSSSSPSSSSVLELAERGDGEAILRLLADEENFTRNIQLRTADGDTALHVAARRGHLKAAVVLLGFGMNVDAHGRRLNTPLHSAAAHGHLRVARRLLEAGAQIEAKNAIGSTALNLAIAFNRKDMVVMLLQKNARLSDETVFKTVSQGHCNIVELFLLNGISADLSNREGFTLLELAANAGRWDTVKLLLTRGASTSNKWMAERMLKYAVKGGQADIVRLLLRRGAESICSQLGLEYAASAAVVWAFADVVPHVVRGEHGRRALLEAAWKGRLEPLVALLEAGVHIDTRGLRNRNALMLAAANGHVACVEELLRRGADINSTEENGFTPLHAASINGRAQCVLKLLAAGASTTKRNSAGKTPMEVARSNAVRNLFIVRESDVSAFGFSTMTFGSFSTKTLGKQ